MNKNDYTMYQQGGAADFPRGAMDFPIRKERLEWLLSEILNGVTAKNLKTGTSFVINWLTDDEAILACAIEADNGYLRLPITDKCIYFFAEVEPGLWHSVVGDVDPWSRLIHDVSYDVLEANDEHAFCGFNRKDTEYWRRRWGLDD